ncbi:glycosyltransferase [Jeongeupia sp. USM3]|uniref:glycosyltransferase n=1 Tax=Jeongeupia sp. USM3 TaxID=1906741 RepID=UPI0009F18111|nr:glycosyltransferase [Jeongeupia sp. USM3]
MKFSVLMSVYKAEEADFLDMALASVAANTLRPSEIVLVEDGPIPGALIDVIEKYRNALNIKSVVLSRNEGLGSALQKGVISCEHELIARFDSDDVCCTERFQRQIEQFERDPCLDICGSFIDEYDELLENKMATRFLPEHHAEIEKFAKCRNPFNHMTVMFRRAMILKAGNYRKFHLYEDYDLWARALQMGAKTYNIQQSLVKARAGRAMTDRRGGIRYAISEYKAQRGFLRSGFISQSRFLRNIMLRIPVRLIPASFRYGIYIKIRKNG